ncbi:hypothetical protein AX16_000819 [Volvariella volvacea WC 439]|nr:hypothetical protein AX16_000819 [Volvariella volvacea WC 439]
MSYTPRTRRKKNLGLTAKEYTKVTGTIASVRRSRQTHAPDDHDPPDSSDVDPPVHPRYDEPSFIAEQSFVRAPLNSRVPTTNAALGVGLSPSPSSSKGKAKQDVLDRVPLEIQEVLVLEDLLCVLMGIEGTYLTYHPDYSPEDDDPLQGIKFVSHPSLDSSLRDLVERILPLGTYYTAITSFIELRSHLDFGLVNHALCAAIRDMLKEYQTLLAQLEHAFNTSPSFSLQKLWFYVHPTVHTLSLIYHLVIEIGTADDPASLLDSSGSSSPSTSDAEQAARDEALGLGGAKLKAVLSEIEGNHRRSTKSLSAGESIIAVKGGEVLTIIYERMMHMSGDATAKAVYESLLREAGKPYVNMLKGWVSTGRLVDPYEELLVKESKFIDRGILEVDYTDEYWERRYTLRDGSTHSGPSQGRHAGVPLPRAVNGRLPGGACIPPLLEPWKHKILLAGKYLNVIRECGIEISKSDSPIDVHEDLSMDNERFYKFLEDAYTHANRTLLQLLVKDQKLILRLRSLKRYFFLSNSFFLTHFLDLASTELRKYASDETHSADGASERQTKHSHPSSDKTCSAAKLQNLLELVLNMEVHQGEEGMFKEDVKITLMQSGVYDFLLKVDSVGGMVVNQNEDGGANGTATIEPEKKKEKHKESSKPLYGSWPVHTPFLSFTSFYRHRRPLPRLQRQISPLPRNFPQDHPPIPTPLPLPPSPQTR